MDKISIINSRFEDNIVLNKGGAIFTHLVNIILTILNIIRTYIYTLD